MSPVSSSPSHIKTHQCGALPNVVLEVDIRECRIMLSSAVVVEASTPRREVPCFKLCQVLGLGV